MRKKYLRPLWYACLKEAAPYALLIVAVFAAYANIYANVFLYDDRALIVHNEILKDGHPLWFYFTQPLSFGSSYYRPFQTLLYRFIVHSAGLSLVAFHFLNITLHAINACLVYVLGQKLKFHPLACLLAALIWALHPLQTEAVTYISATADTLSALFCLGGAIVLFPDFSPRRIGLASLAMICGTFSKESACVFPLLAASCLYFQNEKRRHIKTYLRFWPLVLIAAGYIGLRFALMPPQIGAVPQEAISSMDYAPLSAFVTGLKLLLWPTHLHMGYGLSFDNNVWHPSVLAGIGIILLIITRLVGFERKENLPLNWGLFWFMAAYAPSFTVDGFFYEHWLYLPSAGLFLGVAQSLSMQTRPMSPLGTKAAACVAALSLAVVTGVLTYQQNEIWRDPVIFYNNIFAQGESAPKLHDNLGLVYAARGNNQNAIEQYRIAIQNSNDTLAYAHVGLAITLMHLPDQAQHIEEAKNELQQALKIDAHCFIALDDLAALSEQQGDRAAAAAYRNQAEKIRQEFHINPEREASLSSKG